MTFDKAFEILIGHEGKFTLNRLDNGNWTGGNIGEGTLKGTKYGISAASYPTLDIAGLSLDEAKIIYKRDFWDKCKCQSLPEEIRFDIFDTAVNSGISRAIKLLQKSLKVTQDGNIGIKTLEAASQMAFIPGRLDKTFNANRLLFITSLNDKQFNEFGRGWVNRIANNLLKD